MVFVELVELSVELVLEELNDSVVNTVTELDDEEDDEVDEAVILDDVDVVLEDGEDVVDVVDVVDLVEVVEVVLKVELEVDVVDEVLALVENCMISEEDPPALFGHSVATPLL